ncbi:MAG: signal peptidase I [Hydrococcus sp. RU_2_2]|nr:signal peptidase I [Hydrococcus sp. RU_2_2]NJP17937.1 signal peptidase I [Hydrococcus sp. CRU_1_1]
MSFPSDRKGQKTSWLSILAISLGATFSLGVLGFIIYARTTFKAYYISSSAMEPTLQINDRILANQFAYQSQQPKRGDIILFLPTETLKQQNFHDAFTKRVIGLPGEQIAIAQGKVYINDRPLEENYIVEPPQYDYGPVAIPTNSYFVLGDNRNNSYDSHYWGFVPQENLIGRVSRIYWPPDRMKQLD